MLAHTTRCAGLLCRFSLSLVACSCGGWAGGHGESHYYVVERGRLVELIDVRVQETSSPFNPVIEVLVEPCSERDERNRGQVELPCWPRDEQQHTQALLAELGTKLPDYRHKSVVLHAAKYLNRDVGAWERAWIVGTSPLAVAFLQKPSLEGVTAEIRSDGPTSSTRSTTKPEVAFAGPRDASFVGERDLDEHVDVLLVFPTELVLGVDGLPGTEQADRRLRVKIIHLAEPRTLRSLNASLIDPSKLIGDAARVVEVPVLLPS